MLVRAMLVSSGLVLTIVAAAAAADQVLPGKTLTLKRSVARQTLKLELRDPAIVLPVPGTADDPSAGGLDLTLYSHDDGIAGLSVPGGAGWKVRSGTPFKYRYRNPAAPLGPSPVRALSIRQGKGLKLVARQTGLALGGAQTSVGVLVSMGGTNLCALFDPPSVRRDLAGIFLARNADAPGLAACTGEGLAGRSCGASAQCGGICPNADDACVFNLGVCECVSSHQPCGSTSPACNGECPTGQECVNSGGVPYPTCECLPAGTTGCGEVATCAEGQCSGAFTCNTVTFTCCGGFTITGCGCTDGPPPPPCGGPCPPGTDCIGPAPGFPEACYPTNCSGGVMCPAGSTCSSMFGGMYCLPIACTGGGAYPACGGTCDPGLTCQSFAGDAGYCACAP